MNFVPNTDSDRKEMMDLLGIESVSELFSDVEENIHLKEPMKLPQPLSEPEISHHIKELARSCKEIDGCSNFLGCGTYNHFIPSVVSHLGLRGEFLTSYTPYQAEMSQGTLQAIFEFQSLMCELTKMEVANASMYDGASALAEAAIMASKVKKMKKVIVSRSVHPEYRQVLRTYSNAYGLDIMEVEIKDGLTDTEDLEKKMDEDVAATCVQSPNFFGCIEDQKEIVEISHNNDSLAISCVVEPISLGLLKPPGEMGADIVVGEGQALGNPVSFGGPHLGFITTRSEFLKKIPGRIAGLTVDKNGDEGFILTLQTREQHVRRERATSNICTNQAACALNATIYLALLGKTGLTRIAEICAQRAHYVHKKIIEIEGFDPLFSSPFFNEFSIECSKPPKEINSALIRNNIIGGFELGRFYPELEYGMMMAVTENHGRSSLDSLVKNLSEVIH